MSLLQRAPIDVDAIAGCNTRAEVLFDTTTRLLNASTGLFPYAGAIIHNAAPSDEIEAMLDPNRRHPAIEVASFLKPVNRAMHEWWDNTNAYPHLPLEDMESVGSKARDIYMHFDQRLDEYRLPIRMMTGLLCLQGVAKYRLSVKRKNPFNQKHTAYFDINHDHEQPGRTALVTARVGDLLLFTDLPPTFHEAESSDDRLSLLYISRFVPAEPVE